MDCHVATLLAMTLRLNSTTRHRTLPHRHCERSAAIQRAGNAEPMDCHVAALLAMTERLDSTPRHRTPLRRHCERNATIQRAGSAEPHGLPRRYAPRNDVEAGQHSPRHRTPPRRHCERSAAIQRAGNAGPMDCHVAALLAMTERLNSTTRHRTLPRRHCERSAAIQCVRGMPGRVGERGVSGGRFLPRRPGSTASAAARS